MFPAKARRHRNAAAVAGKTGHEARADFDQAGQKVGHDRRLAGPRVLRRRQIGQIQKRCDPAVNVSRHPFVGPDANNIHAARDQPVLGIEAKCEQVAPGVRQTLPFGQ